MTASAAAKVNISPRQHVVCVKAVLGEVWEWIVGNTYEAGGNGFGGQRPMSGASYCNYRGHKRPFSSGTHSLVPSGGSDTVLADIGSST